MNHRIERAKQLLHAWAFSKFRPDNVVDIDFESGYTSESVLTNFNMVETRNYRNKGKVTARATETRSCKEAKLPMGGSTKSRSIPQLVKSIDSFFKESFSKRQLMLLIALFAPATCLQIEQRGLSDGKIARMLNFKPARCSQIKMKAIDIVVRELFTPDKDDGDERMVA